MARIQAENRLGKQRKAIQGANNDAQPCMVSVHVSVSDSLPRCSQRLEFREC